MSKFKEFLVKNDALEQFQENLLVFDTVEEFEAQIEKTNQINPSFIYKPVNRFKVGFTWSQTKEGREFWDDLHEKWEDEVKLEESNKGN